MKVTNNYLNNGNNTKNEKNKITYEIKKNAKKNFTKKNKYEKISNGLEKIKPKSKDGFSIDEGILGKNVQNFKREKFPPKKRSVKSLEEREKHSERLLSNGKGIDKVNKLKRFLKTKPESLENGFVPGNGKTDNFFAHNKTPEKLQADDDFGLLVLCALLVVLLDGLSVFRKLKWPELQTGQSMIFVSF